MRMTVTLSYEVRSIDCETYKEIFPTSQILEDASKMKREAVKNGEYENAAQYRDLEKRPLRNILRDFGVDKSDNLISGHHWILSYGLN